MDSLPIFVQMFFVLGPAAVAALVVTKLKLPPLVGYLIAGVVLGSVNIAMNGEIFDFLVELGVVTFMFLLGLETDLFGILSSGKSTATLTVGQLLILGVAGYGIGIYLLGLTPLTSIIFTIGLWFSSTIVVVGLLEKLGELDQPHGKALVGEMTIEDLIALILVALIPTFAQGATTKLLFFGIATTLGKAVILVAITFVTGKYVFPKIFPIVEDVPQLLLVFPLAWAFGHMALAYAIGFSMESAAFFAGLSISTLGYSYIVSDKIENLASVGLVFFFVQVGQGVTFGLDTLVPAIIIATFVVLGTSIITLPIAFFAGFGKRAAFVTSVVPGQISEFTLVLFALVVRAGMVDASVLTTITLATVMSMIASSVVAGNVMGLYNKLKTSFLFRWMAKRDLSHTETQEAWDVVVFGADPDYLPVAKKLAESMRVLVIDPARERLQEARNLGLNVLKADHFDPETIENYMPTKFLVSTSLRPAVADLWTIHKIRQRNNDVFTITVNTDSSIGQQLLEAGWNVVVNPEEEAAEKIFLELENFFN